MKIRKWLAPDGAGGGVPEGGAGSGSPEGGAPEKTYTQAQLDAAVHAAVQKAVAAREKELNAAHQKAMEARDLDDAARRRLTDAYDPDLVLGLLDRSKLSKKGEDVEGLDEQLKALRESKSFLFLPKREEAPAQLTGAQPAGAGGKAPSADAALAAEIDRYFKA